MSPSNMPNKDCVGSQSAISDIQYDLPLDILGVHGDQGHPYFSKREARFPRETQATVYNLLETLIGNLIVVMERPGHYVEVIYSVVILNHTRKEPFSTCLYLQAVFTMGYALYPYKLGCGDV